MRYLAARPTRHARRIGFGIALAIVSLAAAQGALGVGASTYVASGLTGPFGAVVAPDNSVWVADTNLGFCKVTGEPTPFAFGSVIPSTCLGGAVPIAPGPTLSGQPAELTTAAGTFAFLPDQGTPAAVFRATWNPPTATFVNAQPIFLSPADNANMRPSAASTTADPAVPNQVYVVARNSTHIWRIDNADQTIGGLTPPTTTQVADVTGLRVRAVASTLVGAAPTATTVFLKDSNGISTAVIPPTPPVAPLPVAVPSAFNPVGALTLVYDAPRRLLYSGTGNAVTPADQGIDTVEQFNTLTQVQTAAPFAAAPAFPGLTTFTAIHGLGVRPDGAVLVLDDPGAVFGNAAGLGRMFLVNRPVAHSGPPVNPATGLVSPNPAFTNSTTPAFTIGGDPGAQCRINTLGGLPVVAPVACAGTFTAPSLANGTGYSLAVQVPGGLFEPRVFTVDTAPPVPAAISSPPNGGLTNGAPLVGFTGEAGATATCADNAGRVASPCTSGSTPFTFTDGPKRLQVTLTDPAGNSTTSAVSFQVDATAPTVAFDGPANGALVRTSPILVGWHASEGAVQFGCSVDSPSIGGFGSCGSPLNLRLGAGAHTIRVQGRDQVGNVGPVAALGFTVGAPPKTPRLRLAGLRIGPKLKIKKVRKGGIALLLQLNQGTRFLHIQLFRVIPPKKNAQTLAGRLQFVIKTDRKPVRAGVYSVSLLSPLVRRAFRTGSYQIEVTPGTNPSTLGVRSIKRFQVVP